MSWVRDVLGFGDGFLPAFVLTWLIESIVYLWAFRALGWLAAGRPTPARAWVLVLVVNLATHPALWLYTSAWSGIGPLVLAEFLAVVVEGSLLGLLLRRSSRDEIRRWAWAYLAALLANAVSLLFGLLLLGPILTALGVGAWACC